MTCFYAAGVTLFTISNHASLIVMNLQCAIHSQDEVRGKAVRLVGSSIH